MAAKSNETISGTPKVHIPAKPDSQVDEIRRYMRRYDGTAKFYTDHWGWFNATRRKGENQ